MDNQNQNLNIPPNTQPQEPTTPPAQPPQSSPQYNKLGLIGASLTVFFAPVGLILCIIALVQIKKTGERGKGLVILAICYATLVTLIAAIVLIAQPILDQQKADEKARINQRSEEIRKEEAQKKLNSQNDTFNAAQFYPKVQVGQTKSEVVLLAGKDGKCTEYSTAKVQYETCIWMSTNQSDARSVNVYFTNGKVERVSKLGF